MFLARLTRPDIAYAVSKLSRYKHRYDGRHWLAAKKVLRYLQGTMHIGLHYKANNVLKLIGFSDSDYAMDKYDRRSVSGYAFLSLVTWTSQKQPVVTCCSTKAEYIALSVVCREIVWLTKHMKELHLDIELPILMHVDNQSAIKLAYKPEFHKRTKYIDVRFHYASELVAEKAVEITHVPTENNKADIFTKSLQKGKF